jgi:hypothetical protein
MQFNWQNAINNIAVLEEKTRYFGEETTLFWGRNNAKIALKNPPRNSEVLPPKYRGFAQFNNSAC